MDVVDEKFYITGRSPVPHDEADDESDSAEDGETDSTAPVGRPQHALHHLEDEQEERANDAGGETREEYQSHDARRHPYKQIIELARDPEEEASAAVYLHEMDRTTIYFMEAKEGKALTDRDYRNLLEFRTGLRQFLRWSEDQARAIGLKPAQHQLLLAVRGHPGPDAATVGDVAASLLLRHHSATELIDRTVAAGWMRRVRDDDDHRVVRLELTRDGHRVLERLSALHLEELARLRRGIPDR